MKAFLLLAAVLASAAGCGGSSATPADTSPFAYDASAPLHYVDHGRVNHDYPIAVDDVSYALPGGKTIEGFLVVPPGKGPFPGVVYLHGSGGDRSELLVPATWLSARGVVALTITTPRSAYTPGASAEQKLREQRAATVADVVAARRAADVLQSPSPRSTATGSALSAGAPVRESGPSSPASTGASAHSTCSRVARPPSPTTPHRRRPH